MDVLTQIEKLLANATGIGMRSGDENRPPLIMLIFDDLTEPEKGYNLILENLSHKNTFANIIHKGNVLDFALTDKTSGDTILVKDLDFNQKTLDSFSSTTSTDSMIAFQMGTPYNDGLMVAKVNSVLLLSGYTMTQSPSGSSTI